MTIFDTKEVADFDNEHNLSELVLLGKDGAVRRIILQDVKDGDHKKPKKDGINEYTYTP